MKVYANEVTVHKRIPRACHGGGEEAAFLDVEQVLSEMPESPSVPREDDEQMAKDRR